MPRTSSAAASRLPTYRLYGESGAGQEVDWLHCESIAERSRLHNWEIRPHRHAVLTQFLHVSRGKVEVQIDTRVSALAAPALLVVPALVVHGLRFTSPSDGTVVTVHETHLNRLLADEPTLRQAINRPHAIQLDRSESRTRELAAAATALRHDFSSMAPWRMALLNGALLRLAVAVGRVMPGVGEGSPSTGSRAIAHVERFKLLVEQQFRQQPSLSGIAAHIGITPTQLNRVCRQVLGHSALEIVHARIVLEAKRELTYTTMSVKQIAHELGFDDPAYFTRFFQRETRMGPTKWRAQAARLVLKAPSA